MGDVAVAARLVRMDATHLDATLEWLQDPELRRLVDNRTAPTGTTNTAYWQARWTDPRAESYAIVDGAGRHVGNCGLRDIDLQRKKAELWIYVATGRDRGVGSAAMDWLLDRAFGDLALNRVYLRVLNNNPGALRFYQRLGFVVEGCAREDTWFGDEPVDATLMSILARERRGRRGFLKDSATAWPTS